jgi:hypothetical protein
VAVTGFPGIPADWVLPRSNHSWTATFPAAHADVRGEQRD